MNATELVPVSHSKDKICTKIFGMKEHGATALGPSLTIALGIASQVARSEIIIATDGLPNVGLGAMDTPAGEEVDFTLEKANSYSDRTTFLQ